MTTTELIELLKKYEKGGVTGRPRKISFNIPTLGLLSEPTIEVTCTGDGIVGPSITFDINGGRLYREEDYPEDEPLKPTWEINV